MKVTFDEYNLKYIENLSSDLENLGNIDFIKIRSSGPNYTIPYHQLDVFWILCTCNRHFFLKQIQDYTIVGSILLFGHTTWSTSYI